MKKEELKKYKDLITGLEAMKKNGHRIINISIERPVVELPQSIFDPDAYLGWKQHQPGRETTITIKLYK